MGKTCPKLRWLTSRIRKTNAQELAYDGCWRHCVLASSVSSSSARAPLHAVRQSEGHRELFAQRPRAELEWLVRSGAADPAFERQALGKPPLARAVDQEGAGQHEADRERRELQARDRAQAFLSLTPEEAVQRNPELAAAYAAAIDKQAESSGLTAQQREVVTRRILHKIAARIAGGEIPTGRLQETLQAESAKVPGQAKDRGSERRAQEGRRCRLAYPATSDLRSA